MTTRSLTTLLLAAALTACGAAQADDAGRPETAEILSRLIANSQPTPFPVPDPDAPRNPGPEQLVTRDQQTGETRVHADFGPAPATGRATVPGGAGIYNLIGSDPLRSGGDKNFNMWSAVPDPTSGTYPRRVRIWATFMDSEDTLRTFNCSGTLIDALHVITAAHCIYKLPGGPRVYPDPWAQTVVMAPGYEDNTFPFGTAEAAQLHAWTNYTISGDFDHDIAVITLERPIGALSGWWGYGYNTDFDYYTGGTWRHEGYPAEDPFDGETLYENAGTFDESPIDGWDYRIGFFAPSWGGASGAGAIRDGNVFGVLSGSNRVSHTEDVILTPTKFAHVGGWIDALTPSGYDLMPLFVQTTASVAAGDNLGSLSFVLANYAGSWAVGDWGYTIYLSPDANITSSDIYLGSGSLPVSLAGKQSEFIALPAPNIPSFVAAGAWFVGVIVDAADADPSNNDSSGQEAAPLAVTCAAAPPAPTLTAPNNGAICRPLNNLFLAWSDLGSGDEYEIQLGTSPGTGSVTSVTNQTNLPVSGLTVSTYYYWRVRCRLGCGDWGPWSSSRTFRTEPNPYLVSSLVAPAEATHCLPGSVGLQWTPLPDAATYQVQISPVWCYEGPITTGITGTQFTATGLDPNTTYYWRVRAETVCGNPTDWSSVPGFCWSFKTAPDSIPAPVVISPADGASCAAYLLWNHAEDWDHYEVQVGDACGTGTLYTTSSNGLWPTGLTGGEVYVWRVRTIHECGLVGDWSVCRSFTLDIEPPTNPTTLASNSHQVGVWSSDNTIDTWWDWGSDNCSGSFPQYATLWDTDPVTEPTVPTISGELTLETSPPLADGQAHWFHLRTIDWAGNPAVDTLHLGPFWIDTTPPEAVPNLWLCEPFDLAGDFGTLTGHWGAAVDSTAGVAGYSYVAQPGPPAGAAPDAVIETAGLTASVTLASGGGWSFGVRAVDTAGNAGPVSALGQVLHDPNLPAFLAPLCGTQLSEGQSYDIEWESVSNSTGGRLKLSTDGGATFTTFAELDQFDLVGAAWPWVVPWADTDRTLLLLEVDLATGRYTAASRYFTIIAVSPVPNDLPLPGGTELVGNYPNPFNPTTTIVYRVGRTMDVRLEIYDAMGRRVQRLVDAPRTGPARYEVVWNGRTDAGRRVASGVYFCRLVTPDGIRTESMTLVQ